MLVRDSHRASLARLMPLEPFPLSSNASNSPSIVLAPRSPGIIASSTRRPISISLPGGSQRPLSLMSMDRIPSGPFSRLATSPVAAESGLEGSYSPLFGLADPGTPTFEDASVLPFIVDPESSQGISDLRPSSVPIRSPRSTVSSSGFTPPPPYTSTPGTPSHESFDFLPLPNLRAGSSARLPSGRMNSPSHDLRRYSPLAVQQSQTLPHRVRLVPVDEDSEMAALNRLREEYQRNNLRNKDRLVSDYDISVLRNLNARRLNRQEIAEVQRKLREAEKEKMNAEAILGRRGLHQPYSGLNDYSMMMPPSAAVQRSDESGALRVREIEARIMAHRKAMRHHQDTRREREIERIERLGAGRDRRYSMPPLL